MSATEGPFDVYGGASNDPLLRSRRELVVQICQLVDYPDNLAISVAALHAIADMAESSVFEAASAHSPHKLYTVLEAAGELPSIMESFIKRLEREETEQIQLFSTDGRSAVERAQSEEGFATSFGLSNLIRLQIVDFLINNASKPGFNLAHYLLGFKASDLLNGFLSEIPPVTTSGVTFNCLYMILELLAYGLGRPSTPILALDHPSLGRKCYTLLRVLMANPRTGQAVAKYLRDHEKFYNQQLAFVSRELVDPSDVGFTFYELQQKAELFEGASIDLFYSISERSSSYLKQTFTLLAQGSTEPSEEPTLPVGASLVSLILAHSLDPVLTPEYLRSLPDPLQEECLVAATCLLKGATRLGQLIIFGIDKLSCDRSELWSHRIQIISSLVPFFARLLVNPLANSAILEHAGAFCLALVAFFERIKSKNDLGLSGDEEMSLLSSSLTALSRSDLSIAARGYLLSSLCQASSTMSKLAMQYILRNDMGRFIDVIAADTTVPAVDTPAIAWKTVAFSFLCSILQSPAMIEIVADRLTRIGLLKSILMSLRSDDRLFGDASKTSNAPMIYLWRAKLSVLSLLVSNMPNLGDRLVDLGFIDAISNLHILESSSVDPRSYQILLPLLRLLLIMSFQRNQMVRKAVFSFVVSHSLTFERLLNTHSLKKLSGDHLACLSTAARLLTSCINLDPAVGPKWRPAFTSLMGQVVDNTESDGPESSHLIELACSVSTMFRSQVVQDSTVVFLGFSRDASSPPNFLPLSQICKLLEFAADRMHKYADLSQSIQKNILTVVVLSVQRHIDSGKAQASLGREIRAVTSAILPLTEGFLTVQVAISANNLDGNRRHLYSKSNQRVKTMAEPSFQQFLILNKLKRDGGQFIQKIPREG